MSGEIRKWKVGTDFYRVECHNGKFEIIHHKVKTVRGKYAYIVEVNEFTFGKRSKKQGDIGWKYPIPPYYRIKIPADKDDKTSLISLHRLHEEFKTTKLSALLYYKRERFESLVKYEEEDAEMENRPPKTRAQYENTLKSMITKARNASKK
jgi:hypothetical protein